MDWNCYGMWYVSLSIYLPIFSIIYVYVENISRITVPSISRISFNSNSINTLFGYRYRMTTLLIFIWRWPIWGRGKSRNGRNIKTSSWTKYLQRWDQKRRGKYHGYGYGYGYSYYCYYLLDLFFISFSLVMLSLPNEWFHLGWGILEKNWSEIWKITIATTATYPGGNRSTNIYIILVLLV